GHAHPPQARQDQAANSPVRAVAKLAFRPAPARAEKKSRPEEPSTRTKAERPAACGALPAPAKRRPGNAGMAMARKRCRLVAAVCLSGLLGGGSGGCLSFVHPLDAKPAERGAACAALHPCARNRVHLFFIDGLNPLDVANLKGVRDYVQCLGFLKT